MKLTQCLLQACLLLSMQSADTLSVTVAEALDVSVPAYPQPLRHVPLPESGSWLREAIRDRIREAEVVSELGGLATGMTVADIGAGDGYFTVRLARRVGESGRVLATDIDRNHLNSLARRLERENISNVYLFEVKDDAAGLPISSVDLVVMAHVYHEIRQPFSWLATLLPSLRANARVVIVEVDRDTHEHGIPPAMLTCELAQMGYQAKGHVALPRVSAYAVVFFPPASPPPPERVDAGACQLARPAPFGAR